MNRSSTRPISGYQKKTLVRTTMERGYRHGRTECPPITKNSPTPKLIRERRCHMGWNRMPTFLNKRLPAPSLLVHTSYMQHCVVGGAWAGRSEAQCPSRRRSRYEVAPPSCSGPPEDKPVEARLARRARWLGPPRDHEERSVHAQQTVWPRLFANTLAKPGGIRQLVWTCSKASHPPLLTFYRYQQRVPPTPRSKT